MNIKDALLDSTVRLYCGNRWLVRDELFELRGEFVVYERIFKRKSILEIYRGNDEENAVHILLHGLKP
jgi:hypothetical protein